MGSLAPLTADALTTILREELTMPDLTLEISRAHPGWRATATNYEEDSIVVQTLVDSVARRLNETYDLAKPPRALRVV